MDHKAQQDALKLQAAIAALKYVEDGTIQKFVLWSPVDLGYLTVHVAKLLREGKLTSGAQTIGRLSGIQVGPGEVLLGPPKVFDRQNIGEFDF